MAFDMGIEQFFCNIRSKCSNDMEYAIEVFRARGFLLEDGLRMSDNAEHRDENYLNKLLLKYGIGRINNGEIILSDTNRVEQIFNLEDVGGSEAFCLGEGWKWFWKKKCARKVELELLEPFVARYVKAISACGVNTHGSCDGNHSDSGGVLYVEPDTPASRTWYFLICKRCLSGRFNLRWNKTFTKVKFSNITKWNTYLEINNAAEFLYNNRILLRRIKAEALKSISGSMIEQLTDQEIGHIFSEAANKLFDEQLNELLCLE